MRTQRIYMNERGETRLHTSGFSWFAMIFPIWALQQRLYKIAAASMVYALLSNQLLGAWFDSSHGWIVGMVVFIASVSQMVALGFLAARLHAYVLERAGFQVTAQER